MSDLPLFLVFDVESIGLYGEGFAVGWVVIDSDGEEHESGLYACDQNKADEKYQENAREWVNQNVPPLEFTHERPHTVRRDFLVNVLCRWLPNGLPHNKLHPKVESVWTDWGYPVETNFLAKIRTTVYWSKFKPEDCLPAPLHEIATLCLAADINPDDFPRLPDELPQHNPLNDARHSARLLVNAMAKLREQRQLASETMVRG